MSYLDPDTPFKSFQKRLSTQELRTPELNDENRQRFHLPRQIVREAITADRIVGMTEDEWRQRQIVERRQRQLAF